MPFTFRRAGGDSHRSPPRYEQQASVSALYASHALGSAPHFVFKIDRGDNASGPGEDVRSAFGFQPPKSVAEIKYKDVYNRYLMNSGWGRWMCFTYDKDVFSSILKSQNYKQRDELHFLAVESDAAPKWWPNVDQSRVTIYLRSDKNGKKSQTYSFEEYLWYDTNSNVVYFHRRYWN